MVLITVMPRACFLFGILFFFSLNLDARVRVPALFSDHMVLQQNQQVPFWGWSDPNATITISCSWDNVIYKVLADHKAQWRILVKTPEAGGPYTISISERNTLVLHHVMIGEVWLCSGQSNMEWTASSGIENQDQAIQNSNQPLIRQIRIPRRVSDYPQEDIDAEWEVCSPETMPGFSAVAYFFALELKERLNIPVGIIHASWGGSAAEAWTPKNIMETDPEFASWKEIFPENYPWPYLPASTFNAMIYPLVPYRIAGALWYQGESNTGNALVYRRLFPAMINGWRQAWNYNFPFYYVQIAPFQYGRPLQGSLVQEAQLKTLSLSPGTGMAVTTDIGNVQDIHPRNKREVGKRLALWALANNYGQTLECSGPLYKSMKVEGQKVIVSFDHAESGLYIKGEKPDLYRIAGEDRRFVEAKVEIDGNQLILSSEQVPEPVAARYAFTNTAEGNLYNHDSLPASPFRTDDWPVVYSNILINSVYDSTSQGFLVSLEGENADKIVYSLNGTEPGLQSQVYTGPFLVKQRTRVLAKSVSGDLLSENVSSREILMHKAAYRSVAYNNPPSEKYPGQDPLSLVNGQKANLNAIGDKEWIGWEGNDLDVVLDLGEATRVRRIETGFLQNQNAWIFLPNQVEISVSSNGRTYNEILKQTEEIRNDRNPLYKVYAADLNNTIRYVRVVARNIGACPPWHPGSGSKAFIFADEISVE